MSKILKSVLEKVSENNNEYRKELRTLNSDIDERTTNLVGTLITESGYTLDFSNTLERAKEEVVNPVSRIIESYVIRDLRSVETVNEQFVEKINDKLENANINSREEKESFSNNLNSLLNDKYLEIVKIKRISFLNEDGVNEEIEEKINNFVSEVTSSIKSKESIEQSVNEYKRGLYEIITTSLTKISNLYQDNFISEVSSSLESAIDYDEEPVVETSTEEFKPYIPEVNVTPEIPSFEEPKEVAQTDLPPIPTVDLDKTVELNAVEEPASEENNIEEEQVPEEMDVTPVAPIEVMPQEDVPKHSYDVEEILKIAKSPILQMPEKKEEIKQSDSFVSVEPITIEKDAETMDAEFNEEEVVNEMIRRLKARLTQINEKKEKLDEESEKLEEDEAFVNDLIESSKLKKEELDRFEQELNDKEKELDRKQQELDKKINDVMPFAKAVLNTDKES